MRSFKDKKECIKTKITKDIYNYIKFNPLNDYQYFISCENSFKIYDIRNNLEMESVNEFANSLEIFNDSKNYFVVNSNGIRQYTFISSKIEKLKDWRNFGNVSYAAMNNIDYNSPEIIVIGNHNGDVYYSKDL